MSEDPMPLIKSPGGAELMCPACGTIYDAWAVDVFDYVPPLGDGCSNCAPDNDRDDVQ